MEREDAAQALVNSLAALDLVALLLLVLHQNTDAAREAFDTRLIALEGDVADARAGTIDITPAQLRAKRLQIDLLEVILRS
ncbi:hypothetical protein [Phenylobacterium sp.]|jgi:hypothetical protein|uniref:hypothetical protein n=1 Tax=Phenylobacterium sp. TaxID=1871053 RepID=UPI0025D00073|nr:hypothetical protein [Phenylobacterium sp.]MCA6343509.1 hypothetical protein [Phenylobacterium sp.]